MYKMGHFIAVLAVIIYHLETSSCSGRRETGFKNVKIFSGERTFFNFKLLCDVIWRANLNVKFNVFWRKIWLQKCKITQKMNSQKSVNFTVLKTVQALAQDQCDQ